MNLSTCFWGGKAQVSGGNGKNAGLSKITRLLPVEALAFSPLCSSNN